MKIGKKTEASTTQQPKAAQELPTIAATPTARASTPKTIWSTLVKNPISLLSRLLSKRETMVATKTPDTASIQSTVDENPPEEEPAVTVSLKKRKVVSPDILKQDKKSAKSLADMRRDAGLF